MHKWKQIILLMQGALMVMVTLSPLIDPGYFDFSLFPVTAYKTIGLILNLVGFYIITWAILHLRKRFTVSAQPKQNTILITDGPFSWVRNPMYFGGTLMCFGWGLSLNSKLACGAAFLLLIVLLLKIRLEEVFLEQEFGKSYLEYKQKVKRILPGIY